MRAVLEHSVLSATDGTGESNVVPSAQVYVYEEDGTTLWEQSLYAADSGGVPLVQPLVANARGFVLAYSDLPRRCVLSVGGIVGSASAISYPSDFRFPPNQLMLRGPRPYIDARTYGFEPTASATTNRAALQAAIDAAIAAGAGARVYMRPGTYSINNSITVDTGNATNSIEIFGDGPDQTIITQTDVTKDIFVAGFTAVTGVRVGFASVGTKIHDLSTTGGRYALRMNNILRLEIKDVYVNTAVVGLYGEGQNEAWNVSRVNIIGCTQNGILTGQQNGGSDADDQNQPILQKSNFDHLKVADTTGGAAISITTTTGAAAAGASGFNQFNDIQLVNNHRDLMVFGKSINTVLTRISTETQSDAVLDASNTYDVIRADDTPSSITIRDSQLQGGVNTGTDTYRYVIYATDGVLTVENTSTTVSRNAGTASIRAGLACRIKGGTVGGAVGAAGGIVLDQPSKCEGIETFDSSGNEIRYHAILTPAVIGSHNLIARDTLAASATKDLGVRLGPCILADATGNAVAEVYLNGAAGVVREVADPDTIVDVTDTGSVWAIYWTGSLYRIKNRTVGDRTFSLKIVDLT